ncbi:MAG: MGMT family protein [Actinomycetota bacterium]
MSEPPELTEFESAVLALVGSLDPGDIMSYGEVAAEVGKPGAARAVGSTLRRHGSSVPWWRIVAANGRLVPGGEERHRAHLAAEGIEVRNGRVVMGGR